MELFRNRSLRVSPRVFDDAALTAGIELDDSQRVAVTALCSPDGWVYLTGPAGRGKSWLMDVYTGGLPADAVARLHWHTYIRDLHRAIDTFGGMKRAVRHLLGNARVLCFDELDVDDPADGIFVMTLLRAADEHGIRVIITSNRVPDALMPSPLFHDSFLPSIHFIESHCTVIELDAGIDYRTRSAHVTGFGAGRWVTNTDNREPASRPVDIVVAGRTVRARYADSDRLHVEFVDICGTPLGAADYLDLAGRFTRWVITGIPDLANAGREPAQRFLHLVDVLYDNDIRTTFIAGVPLAGFGRAHPRPVATARLLSRLSELSSHA